MIQYFPFNYFWVSLSPTRIFKYRRYLSILQSLFILLFLSALLLIPATLQLSKQMPGQLDFYSSLAFEEIDDRLWQQFQQGEEKTDQTSDHFIKVGGEKPGELDDSLLAVWLGQDEFILKDPNKPMIQAHYTNKQTLLEAKSLTDFKKELSKQWSEQYALPLRLVSLAMVSLLISINLLLLVAGSTFFLSLMKKSPLYTIESVKEAFVMTLNSLGLPTFITFICGWFTKNLAALFIIHGLLFVLNLLASYWRTHFNDQYIDPTLDI
ncbi:hypothetical protein [Dolosicoccus paucivorans]|uniref:DUF1189 domain-containing protein n=1 Tax=Dolosicoccus paucivorans TaxID=84521 RepID=A0A1G8LZ69_9LACT|nr:hypothetical protein [Dolosicoccus paucivorans]PMB83883.1 hypothetical protein CJ206_06815 [Dolosicoccus paucivorans]PMC58025.1 hypothetical protein CJ205_06560 [Dolosicoccus paucivorans]SDI61042.1 Maltodextrin utilization protein YvdJ [Dolosicoccus paucivorans]